MTDLFLKGNRGIVDWEWGGVAWTGRTEGRRDRGRDVLYERRLNKKTIINHFI